MFPDSRADRHNRGGPAREQGGGPVFRRHGRGDGPRVQRLLRRVHHALGGLPEGPGGSHQKRSGE